MRTTLNIDEHVLEAAKAAAAESGRTLGQVVEDALRAALLRRSPGGPRKRVKLPTFTGRGLQPGIDLDDNATLLDVLESDPG